MVRSASSSAIAADPPAIAGRGSGRSFLAASCANLVANATWWMQPLLMHDLVAMRGLSEPASGMVISAEMAAMALGSIAATRLLVGRTLMSLAVWGTLVAFVGSLLTLVVDGYGPLLLARVVTGIGSGCALMVANATATHFADPDKTFARLAAGNIVFGIALTGLFPSFSSLLGGVSPFALTFVSVALLILPQFLMPRGLRVEAPHKASLDVGGTALRNIAILAVATFAIGSASGIMWVYYALIGERLGMRLEAIDHAISLAVFSSLLAAGLASAIGGRFGRIGPMGLGLAALAGAVLALSDTRSVLVFHAATMLNISAIYFLTPYLFGAAAVQDRSGRGAVYVGSAFYLTGAIAPATGGVLATSIGIGVMGGVTLVICVLAFVGALMVERSGVTRRALCEEDPAGAPAPI